jgi:hypothetical protein
MFGIVITPFWLAISVLYFGLSVFHWRLSTRVSVDIEFPGKDAVFSGYLAKFEEDEYRKTAFLNKQTLRFAAGGFFIAFVISFIQSISISQGQIALNSESLVAVFAIAVAIVLIVVLLVVLLVDSTIYNWFDQVAIPWMWYNKKKGVKYDLIVEPLTDGAAYVDGGLVLLAAAFFTVRPGIKKSRLKLGEGVTLEVSGELRASDRSMVNGVDYRGMPVKAPALSDEGAKLLEQTCDSQHKGKSHNITMEGRFKDREKGKHVSWQLNEIKLTSKKSSKTFCFSASARKSDY